MRKSLLVLCLLLVFCSSVYAKDISKVKFALDEIPCFGGFVNAGIEPDWSRKDMSRNVKLIEWFVYDSADTSGSIKIYKPFDEYVKIGYEITYPIFKGLKKEYKLFAYERGIYLGKDEGTSDKNFWVIYSDLVEMLKRNGKKPEEVDGLLKYMCRSKLSYQEEKNLPTYAQEALCSREAISKDREFFWVDITRYDYIDFIILRKVLKPEGYFGTVYISCKGQNKFIKKYELEDLKPEELKPEGHENLFKKKEEGK